MTIFAKKRTPLEKSEYNARLLYKLKLEREMLNGIVLRIGLIIDELSASEPPPSNPQTQDAP